MGWLYLLLSFWGAALTWNVWRPNASHRHLATASWIFGWLTAELAPYAIAGQLLVTGVFALAGAFESGPGQVGLAISVASWIALGAEQLRAGRARKAVEGALREGFDDPAPAAPAGWRRRLSPLPRMPREVEAVRGLQFARVRGANLKLDLYRPRERAGSCPLLLQIHGGAWIAGDRKTQAVPLMHTLAARGWVCASVDYRLSPGATFPDHLVDVKRALAWLKQHGAEHGADPDFVVVTGGSAGGHLAALLALTPNDPAYQPGFEHVDTRVQGCIPFYGVYDLTDRAGDWPNDGLRRVLEKHVVKGSVEEEAETYERGSPLRRITPDAPPFFVIHGSGDTMVPIAHARRFRDRLREVSAERVLWAEVPGAQHAFESFWSARTAHAVDAAVRFAEALARSRATDAAEPRDVAAG
jgi:acetyl esterase/lipase